MADGSLGLSGELFPSQEPFPVRAKLQRKHVQGHTVNRGVYGDGDDGQVEVVEHDGDVVVEAGPRVEVEAEGPTADQRDGRYLRQPEEGGERNVTRTLVELQLEVHLAQGLLHLQGPSNRLATHGHNIRKILHALICAVCTGEEEEEEEEGLFLVRPRYLWLRAADNLREGRLLTNSKRPFSHTAAQQESLC
ncbi:hypothetical protein EYF80_022836 [Liparis tanakae]|uniref:Uncharacterized protein n=1 Tax=Liparis tanakae TaxID=230148 RepID=A0A4Z2HM00_9TELE|nr:hypothetical protein EYF80_022836 [Liparis tanakae]